MKVLLNAREDVLNSFKSNLFPVMSDTTPYDTTLTARETSMNEDFLSMKSYMMKKV